MRYWQKGETTTNTNDPVVHITDEDGKQLVRSANHVKPRTTEHEESTETETEQKSETVKELEEPRQISETDKEPEDIPIQQELRRSTRMKKRVTKYQA